MPAFWQAGVVVQVGHLPAAGRKPLPGEPALPLTEPSGAPRRRGAHIAILCFVVAVAAPLLLAVRQPVAAAAPPTRPDATAATPAERPAVLRASVAAEPAVSRASRTPTLDEDQVARELARAPQPGGAPRAPEPRPLASLPDGLGLLVPVAPDVEAVLGFHQAGGGDSAALTPGEDAHEVMPSRGRGTDPTSAVDVAVPEGTQVLSPVDGVVDTAASYRLYGRTDDDMVVVVPDGFPDAAVTLLHLDALEVAEGDRVVAGETPLGVVRTLPFGSQIDRLTGDARPHVHIEVRPHE